MTAESLRSLPAKTILVASLAACFTLTAGSALAQTATETELARKLDQLAAELAARLAARMVLAGRARRRTSSRSNCWIARVMREKASSGRLKMSAPKTC